MVVQRYEDCYYKCPNERCGAGYSNASVASQRTLIHPSPELNVPEEVRSGLDQTLSKALNVRNRVNKRAKFAFETSEDAVTWTVFSGVRSTGFPSIGNGLKAMLLWGVPDVAASSSIRETLEAILRDDVGENPMSFTEPDIILALEDRIVVIEVKYLTGNSVTTDRDCFNRYLAARRDAFAVSDDQVHMSGLYELTRNWVVGNLLSDRLALPFRFINLGLELKCRSSAEVFASQLATDERRSFVFQTWHELLATLGPLPPWLRAYARSRGLC